MKLRLFHLPMLAFVAAIILPAAIANAQFFPRSTSMEELEAAAAEAEKAQLAREEAERLARERAVENAERWRAISSAVDDADDEYRKIFNRDGEAQTYMNALKARNRFLNMGTMYYNMGQFKTAKSTYDDIRKQQIRGYEYQAGWYHLATCKTELTMEFCDGYMFEDEWNDKFESRMDRELDKALDFITRALDEGNQLQPEQRANQMNTLRAYVDSFKTRVRRAYDLQKQIERDTFTASLMWDLIKLYREQLVMWHRHRAWLLAYAAAFPEDAKMRDGSWQIEMSLNDGEIGAFQSSVDRMDDAMTAYNEAWERADARRNELRRAMQEAERDGGPMPEMTDEERQWVEVRDGQWREYRQQAMRALREAREKLENKKNEARKGAGMEREHEGDKDD